ncbi:hypothetical protein ACFC8N_33555 [Streptomyces sp. NPDC055966]|uniref:Mu transposase domain-containing protein n=1 Tax=Streptomyces sp. NPDC055966 TaxID=3345669 RepID=UPI0035DF8B59
MGREVSRTAAMQIRRAIRRRTDRRGPRRGTARAARESVGRGPWDDVEVANGATLSIDSVRYSVPRRLAGQTVWAHFHGDEVVVTTVTETAAVEAARHQRSAPGVPSVKDEPCPPREDREGDRPPESQQRRRGRLLAARTEAAS